VINSFKLLFVWASATIAFVIDFLVKDVFVKDAK